jgi:RNA polymerase sigma-70 factor (ECF subfamily)
MTDPNVFKGEAIADTSSSLLIRVRSRDQTAWERLVSLYSPLVYRWCKQRGLQAADAADLGQEVFEAVARKIADFQHGGQTDSFRAWLRTITHNKYCDFLRRLRPEVPLLEESDMPTVPVLASDASDHAAMAEEDAILYRRAVELMQTDFEERTWQAFWRVVVEGQRPGQVAADLAITPNAVYAAKARVLRRLREEFAELIDLKGSSSA